MYKSYWHCRVLNKGFSIVSVLFSCLLNFTVRTGKDFLWESSGSQCTCRVMTTVTKQDYSDHSELHNEVETWTEIHVTCLTFMEWWKSQGSAPRPPKPHFLHELVGPGSGASSWALLDTSRARPFPFGFCTSFLKPVFLTWDELPEADFVGLFKIKYFSNTWKQILA